jgi:hypothetical protein
MKRRVGEHEIGSESWMRERIERGLDPAEADRPDDVGMLSFEPTDHWPEPQAAWSIPRETFFER